MRAAQVLMNGLPLGEAFQRHCAYVPQEDIFVPTLSAWETLKVRSRHSRLSGILLDCLAMHS